MTGGRQHGWSESLLAELREHRGIDESRLRTDVLVHVEKVLWIGHELPVLGLSINHTN